MKKTSKKAYEIGFLILLLTLCHKAFSQSRFSMSVDVAPAYELFRPTLNLPQTFSQDYSGVRVGSSIHFRVATNWSLASSLWLDWKRARRESNSASNQHSFQIPLLVNYQIGTKKLAPYVSAGVLLDKPKYTVFDISGVSDDITVYNVGTKVQLKYVIGAGIRYEVNEQLVGIVQPLFTYGKRENQKSSQLSLQTQLVFQF